MLTKIWRLTPAQVACYTPGMDLGEPDEIKNVPAVTYVDFLRPEVRERAMLRSKRANPPAITPGEYADYRDEGYTDREIAKMVGISAETLRVYKNRWKRKGIVV